MYEDYMDDITSQDIDINENREMNIGPQMSNQNNSGMLVGNIFMYTVRRGDNLYAISRRYGTSPQIIACMNRINMNGKLFIGQKLYIPVLFQNQQPPQNVPPRPPMGPQPRNAYDLYF